MKKVTLKQLDKLAEDFEILQAKSDKHWTRSEVGVNTVLTIASFLMYVSMRLEGDKSGLKL